MLFSSFFKAKEDVQKIITKAHDDLLELQPGIKNYKANFVL